MQEKMRGKMGHMQAKLRLKHCDRGDSSSDSGSRTESYRHTLDSPRKFGWFEYRVTTFWHKGYFRLHGHYITYSHDGENKEERGSINLWNVQDIVLDDKEITLTLNENALMRHGIKGWRSKKEDPTFRIRAPNALEAQEWLKAMQACAVVGDTSQSNSRSSESNWTVERLQLQSADGTPLHTITSMVTNGAKLLLGNGIQAQSPVDVQVTVAGPRQERAIGVQRLPVMNQRGDLHVPVRLASGESLDVCITWLAEGAEGLSIQGFNITEFVTKPEVLMVFAGALVASIISIILFPIVLAAGGYWVLQQQGPQQSSQTFDCFVTQVVVNTGGTADSRQMATPRSVTSASVPSSSDVSISQKELEKIAALREALQDLKESGSGVDPEIYDKHVNCDYRLVRFVRARPTIAASADMVRESLRWRTEFGADTILQTYKPDPWVFGYFGVPIFIDCLEKGEDRRKCYQRDHQGHLSVYFRGGFVDWKTAYNAVHGDMDLAIRVVVWVFELLREDVEKLHEETKGSIPSYINLVYDLEGFEYGNQVSVSTMVPVAQRLFYILNINYPELINRILIVRAPWLFSSIWTVLKPLIPPELLQKMPMSGGGKLSKVVTNITPTFPLDQIPKFLGGNLTDAGGDEECRYTIGPRGPFLPDKGKSFLAEGIANPPAARTRSSAKRAATRHA